MLSLLLPHLSTVRKFIFRIRKYHVGGVEKCFRMLSAVRGLTVGKHFENLTKIMLKIISEILEKQNKEIRVSYVVFLFNGPRKGEWEESHQSTNLPSLKKCRSLLRL